MLANKEANKKPDQQSWGKAIPILFKCGRAIGKKEIAKQSATITERLRVSEEQVRALTKTITELEAAAQKPLRGSRRE